MVHIFANTIPLPEYKQPWEEAVLKGIGNRLASENWSVSILAPADSGDYFVHVERPDLPDCPKIVIQFLRPIELDRGRRAEPVTRLWNSRLHSRLRWLSRRRSGSWRIF